jgi:hypothetical protein
MPSTNMADFTPVAVAGLQVEQTGSGKYRTAVFTFDELAITMADEAGVVAYGSQKLCDFPLGAVTFLNAVASLDVVKDGTDTAISATFDGDFGVGTAAASNNGTLATTEQNVIPTTATPQAVAGVTTAKGVLAAPVTVDGTGGALDLYLNFLIDDGDQDIGGQAGTESLVISGEIVVHYLLAGDH